MPSSSFDNSNESTNSGSQKVIHENESSQPQTNKNNGQTNQNRAELLVNNFSSNDRQYVGDFLNFVCEGDIEKVKEFLKKIPELKRSVDEKTGKSALEIARESGHWNIVKLFEQLMLNDNILTASSSQNPIVSNLNEQQNIDKQPNSQLEVVSSKCIKSNSDLDIKALIELIKNSLNNKDTLFLEQLNKFEKLYAKGKIYAASVFLYRAGQKNPEAKLLYAALLYNEKDYTAAFSCLKEFSKDLSKTSSKLNSQNNQLNEAIKNFSLLTELRVLGFPDSTNSESLNTKSDNSNSLNNQLIENLRAMFLLGKLLAEGSIFIKKDTKFARRIFQYLIDMHAKEYVTEIDAENELSKLEEPNEKTGDHAEISSIANNIFNWNDAWQFIEEIYKGYDIFYITEEIYKNCSIFYNEDIHDLNIIKDCFTEGRAACFVKYLLNNKAKWEEEVKVKHVISQGLVISEQQAAERTENAIQNIKFNGLLDLLLAITLMNEDNSSIQFFDIQAFNYIEPRFFNEDSILSFNWLDNDENKVITLEGMEFSEPVSSVAVESKKIGLDIPHQCILMALTHIFKAYKRNFNDINAYLSEIKLTRDSEVLCMFSIAILFFKGFIVKQNHEAAARLFKRILKFDEECECNEEYYLEIVEWAKKLLDQYSSKETVKQKPKLNELLGHEAFLPLAVTNDENKELNKSSNKRLSSETDVTPPPPAKKPKFTSLTANEKAKYCCPLSGKIFLEPVLAPDKKHYEREVLQKQHPEVSFISANKLKSEIETLLQTKPNLRYEVYISQSARDFMLQAIQEDNLDLFMGCLEHKELLFACDDKKQSWLHCVLNNTLTDNKVKMVSELLKKDIDVSLRDTAGNLAMHLAVKQGNPIIISNLLEAHAKRGCTINSTNKKGQTPLGLAKECQDKAIIELLSPKYDYKLHWVKDNTLTYKNDKRKVSLQINAGNFFQHYTQATKNSKDTSENIVYGSLTFLLRIKQGEQYVYNTLKVPLSFGDNLHVNNVYQNKAELLKDVKRYNPAQKEEVEKLKKQWENAEKEPDPDRKNKLLANFHQKLHHSERALFKKLESQEEIKKIVKQLNKDIKNHYPDIKPGHIKIKMVILDMFSTHYLCKLCEPATGYFQSPGSPFLRKLSNALLGYYYQVSKRNEMKNPFYSNLPYMLTRVGATMPANLQPVKPFAKHEDTLFNLHDLKKQGKQLILQTDLDQKLKNDPHTAVNSRKQKDERGLSLGSQADMIDDTSIPIVEISDESDDEAFCNINSI